jgi:hypothetical protein
MKAHARLLYQASRDGFAASDFFRCAAEQGPTVTIVKVAGTGYIFGAYTAVAWPHPIIGSGRTVHLDPSGRSLLFSLVNGEGSHSPFCVPLSDTKSALSLREGNEPMLGAGRSTEDYPDLFLMYSGRSADDPQGNCANRPDASCAYQLSGTARVYDECTVAGSQFFAAEEVEVYAVAPTPMKREPFAAVLAPATPIAVTIAVASLVALEKHLAAQVQEAPKSAAVPTSVTAPQTAEGAPQPSVKFAYSHLIGREI